MLRFRGIYPGQAHLPKMAAAGAVALSPSS
jgi:hypothetical protein